MLKNRFKWGGTVDDKGEMLYNSIEWNKSYIYLCVNERVI